MKALFPGATMDGDAGAAFFFELAGQYGSGDIVAVPAKSHLDGDW